MPAAPSGTITDMSETTVRVRGRPRSAEADQAIALATTALLEEEGYSAMTMQGVAARAGVSTATLYRRWPCKQDLVVATLKSLITKKPESIDTGSLAGDLDELLHKVAAKLSSDDGQLLKGIVGEAMLNPALAQALRDGMERQPLPQVLEIVRRAVARSEIPEPADDDLVVGLVMGVMHERWLLSDKPLTDQDIKTLVPMLVRALGGSA